MELSWYGLGCIRLMDRGSPSVVIDPYHNQYEDLKAPKLQGNIVVSMSPIDEPENARWRGIREVKRTVAGPGEYEIGGVFITGIATFAQIADDGLEVENDIYSVDINGVRVCHLGRLATTLTQAQIEPIGHIHVLCVPVGLPDGITPNQAADIVSMLEPDIVVPIYYDVPESISIPVALDPVDGFVKAMGVEHRTVLEKLRVSSGQDSESTQVIFLEVTQ